MSNNNKMNRQIEATVLCHTFTHENSELTVYNQIAEVPRSAQERKGEKALRCVQSRKKERKRERQKDKEREREKESERERERERKRRNQR